MWEVVERWPDKYVVTLTEQGRDFIGRLKLHSPYRQRGTRVKFEKRLHEFTVSEILREEYSGIDFPGHDWIDIGFGELESLIRDDRPDWRGALENAKGVYLITDAGTGRLYVGAAYGDGGILVSLAGIQRDRTWQQCRPEGIAQGLQSGLLPEAISGFRFWRAIPPVIADAMIVERETHWKRVLQSRGEFGFNRN